jgi:hypothetical protein
MIAQYDEELEGDGRMDGSLCFAERNLETNG